MTREDLLRSREYWMVQLQNDLYAAIDEYKKKHNLNRSELAKELNVTKGYVSQVLNGDFDHKISKFVDLSLFAGKAPLFFLVDLEKYIKDDELGKKYDLYESLQPTEFFEDTTPKKFNHSYLDLFAEKNKELTISPSYQSQ